MPKTANKTELILEKYTKLTSELKIPTKALIMTKAANGIINMP